MTLPSVLDAAAPLRILFVTTSLGHGGAEQHSVTLMNRMAARGHDCHAVYVKNDSALADRIQLPPSATVLCLDAAGFFDRQAIRKLSDHLNRLRPFVIVSANPFALMYASLACHHAGLTIPQVITYHSTRVLGVKEHLKMLIDRCFIRLADCLVFVSENQHSYWQRRWLTARQTRVISNGIDPGHFQPEACADKAPAIRSRFGFSVNDYVIGMVAVLRPEKNHVQLLAAVARLRKRGIAANALLIGDGPMRRAIELTALALNIAPWVHITGYQEDVRPYVAACDVIVLCSVTEALSLAAIEAMALERPVVHSRVGGAAEMILPDFNGALFPVGDTDALVERLIPLSNREFSRQQGRNARQVALAKFSIETMVDRYEQLLHALCRQPARSTALHQPGRRQRDWPLFPIEQQTRSSVE